MKFLVKRAPNSAAGNDIVHINEVHRGTMGMNKVCKIKVDDKYVYATVRGNNTKNEIKIDNQLRLQLDIKLDQEYNFSVDCKWYYFFIAPFCATNSGVRAAYIIAFISVFISLLPIVFYSLKFLVKHFCLS